MYKLLVLSIAFLFYSNTSANTIDTLQPKLGKLIDKNSKDEINFNKFLSECEKFFEFYEFNNDTSTYSDRNKFLFENCSETIDDYWSVIGYGCSWYCGGGLDTNTCTSNLKPTNGIFYGAENIHDLSYKTAWIEGVEGDGIGEMITYHFPPTNPRITEIIIVNGYVKSEQLWKDNSRVKKLKMYLNNIPYAILNIEDSRQEQHFKMKPLGYAKREPYSALELKPWWTLSFEIIEVYRGNKFEDTAITELYFDGIDVH